MIRFLLAILRSVRTARAASRGRLGPRLWNRRVSKAAFRAARRFKR